MPFRRSLTISPDVDKDPNPNNHLPRTKKKTTEKNQINRKKGVWGPFLGLHRGKTTLGPRKEREKGEKNYWKVFGEALGGPFLRSSSFTPNFSKPGKNQNGAVVIIFFKKKTGPFFSPPLLLFGVSPPRSFALGLLKGGDPRGPYDGRGPLGWGPTPY